MRIEFEMTQEQLDRLLEACRPQPYIVAGGVPPISTQQRANMAWAALGDEMLFDASTVRPIPGKGDRFFTAEPKDGYCVQLDGSDWCAQGPGFLNLQESPAGFGATPQIALAELRKAMVAEAFA